LKQETMCVVPNFTNAGSNSLQTSIRTEHRGSKEQPFRGSEEGNELPGMTGRLVLRFFGVSEEIVGRDSKSALV
jgi:hypothetical protein